MAKILLLDDSMTILKVVRLTFAANTDYQILWARTSSEAEKMIAADHPDAIIGYVNFAADKSLDFFKRIRMLQNNILFLAETMEDIATFRDAGFEEFLKKPFVSDDLRSAVQKILQPKDMSITQMAPTIPLVSHLQAVPPPPPQPQNPPIPPSMRATVVATEFNSEKNDLSLQWDPKEEITPIKEAASKKDLTTNVPEMSFDLEALEQTYRATISEPTIPIAKLNFDEQEQEEVVEEENLEEENVVEENEDKKAPFPSTEIVLDAPTSEPFIVEDMKINKQPLPVFRHSTREDSALSNFEFGGEPERTLPSTMVIDSREIDKVTAEVLKKIDVGSLESKIESKIESALKTKFSSEFSILKTENLEHFSTLKIETKEQMSSLKVELQNGLLKNLRNELKTELLSALQNTISEEIKIHIAKWAQTEALIICRDEIQKSIQKVLNG